MGKFSDTDNFNNSGPSHIVSVDWENPHHRRSVVASLVNGVYVREKDHQLENLQGHQAQAPPWWNFFNFEPVSLLIDDEDNTIFGIVYKYSLRTSNNKAPKYVIAFRGTLPKLDSMVRDVKLDLKCWKFTLHRSSRFQLAIRAVEDVVKNTGATNVWLAGHSLGSAIALLVGKNMTKEGKPMETFVFNPPFISYPIEWIQNQKMKTAIRFAGSFVRAGIGLAVKKLSTHPNESIPFSALSDWIPELFLNPADPICSGYIGYFQHRKTMEKIGASRIERFAAQQSVRCLTAGVLSRKDFEAWHLLPSANLTINSSLEPSHALQQWWDPNFDGQYERYQF